MNTPNMIELDGAQGEGGGQVLRSALTLSMITGTPFRITNIRAKRNKPGLLRQHLTAVQAATAISGATVDGAVAGSQTLSFAPGELRGGDYQFAIGTAGSCTLVLQTVLPALWFADAPSSVLVSGGTHNKSAPPADFLIRAWAPLLARMGIQQTLALQRHGFYPAGGGEVLASITPNGKPQPLHLLQRGKQIALQAEALVAGVARRVAQRELQRLEAQLGCAGEVCELPAKHGPGNALLLAVQSENVTELFTGFGERGVSAEAVADGLAAQAKRYLASSAAVGEYLADQLLLPLALAGGGSFTTSEASSHLQTNAAVIEKFLPIEVRFFDEVDAVRVELG